MKAYIIHGYLASAEDHWFEYTKNELEKLGIDVSILTLPTPDDPKPDEWQEALDKQIKYIDKDTYFISHSLGSISFLTYLLNLDIKKIAGYILVSPFNNSLPELKQLDIFLDSSLDYTKLKALSENRVVICAKDDTIVPFDLSISLAKSLDAKIIPLEKGGHFLASDGFKEFPLLIEEFKSLLPIETIFPRS